MPSSTPSLPARDPRNIRMLSYYRDAELRGAGLLLRMLEREEDPVARTNLARHLADEARHGWLITQRIADLGAEPIVVQDGYQTRMARAAGIPRTMLDLYAITMVAEERAQARYTAHLVSGAADPDTAYLLHQVSKDEIWHLGWVQGRLADFAAAEGPARVDAAVKRYRDADAVVAADLAAIEKEICGFTFSAVPEAEGSHMAAPPAVAIAHGSTLPPASMVTGSSRDPG